MKVLIVDDEATFRLGFQSCINWQEHGIEWVGSACDGLEAVDKIAVCRPDVVFTDIVMPGMDGLELTRHIKGRYPDMKTVILSCRNEYEYVREALKLGATDYMLKLYVNPANLSELLSGLRVQIEAEKNKRNREMTVQHEFEVNIGRIKEGFLQEWIQGSPRLTQPETARKLANLGVRLSYEHNVVLVIRIDGYEQAVQKFKDEQLLRFVFMNLASEIARKYPSGEFVGYKPNEFIGVVSVDGSEHGAAPQQLIEEIGASTRKLFNFTISAGISATTVSLPDLRHALEEAEEALLWSFYAGHGYIAAYKAERPFHAGAFLQLDIDAQDRLHHWVEVSDLASLNGYIGQLAGQFTNPAFTHPRHVKDTYKEPLFVYNRSLTRFGGSLADVCGQDPLAIIDRAEQLSSLSAWFMRLTERMVEHVRYLKNRLYRSEIVNVIDHIKNNLDRNLSLAELARIAHMNERYFCQVFKKETGTNLTDYVSGLKVEQAKKLLRDEEIKVFEVAQQLGYENETYFTKIFKKLTGSTPSQYKKSFRQPRGAG